MSGAGIVSCANLVRDGRSQAVLAVIGRCHRRRSSAVSAGHAVLRNLLKVSNACPPISDGIDADRLPGDQYSLAPLIRAVFCSPEYREVGNPSTFAQLLSGAVCHSAGDRLPSGEPIWEDNHGMV